MKNKNIYFVGYYKGIEKKELFLDLFDCKKKYFLENDKKFENISDGIYYYPTMFYKFKGKAKFNSQEIKVNEQCKNLYRRDYRNYLGSKKMKAKSLQKDKFLIFKYIISMYVSKHKGIEKFKFSNAISSLKRLKKQILQRDTNLLKSIRKFRMKVNFLKGYSYSLGLLKSLNLGKNDVFILWGKPQSSYQLLMKYLDDKGIPYYFAEYGELPGTITLSASGIFGETFTERSWNTFSSRSLSSDDIEYANNILNSIKKNQISIKNYKSNMFFLMKYFWNNSVHVKNRPKILYVNGSELFASGFYHKRWGVDREGVNPNKMLLRKVVDYFDDSFMIMYKEHPMTNKNNPSSLLDPLEFPTVNFIDAMNIHDILEMSDIIISLPSKVVITALQYGKPTFVLGEFTIPKTNQSMNYYTSNDFRDIEKMRDFKDIETNEEFEKFIARLIKYNLILVDKDIFYQLNHDGEKRKIELILNDESR